MNTSTKPTVWNAIFLKQNPFPSSPPRVSQEIVWAGFADLQQQFSNIFFEALSSDRTQVVLNWGEYGSGKTHAAIYYQLKENLLGQNATQLRDISSFYIQTPREQEKADILLYRHILEAIKFQQVRIVIRDIIREIGSEATLDQLQRSAESEVLGKAIWLLGQNRTRAGQMVLLDDPTKSSEWDLLLESYFYSQATKTDLRKLGLSRGIDSAHDRFKVLGAILSSIIGFGPIININQHSRAILWIDEMEYLIYFTSKYFLPFTQGLRELIDHLPNYFTLFLNITLASPEAFRDVETILGKALLDRKTHEVYFQEPDIDEAYEYVVSLLSQYRTSDWDSSKYPITYPFTDDGLKILISSLLTRTPRDINQACSDIIDATFRRHGLKDDEIIIDREAAIDWANSRTEFNP